MSQKKRINDRVSQKEEKFFLNDMVLVLNGTFTTFRKKVFKSLSDFFDKKLLITGEV